MTNDDVSRLIEGFRAAGRDYSAALKCLDLVLESTAPCSPERDVGLDVFFSSKRAKDEAESRLRRARYFLRRGAVGGGRVRT